AVAWSAPSLKDQYVTLFSSTWVRLHNLSVAADEGLVFTPDGKTLVTVTRGGSIFVTRWNVADGKQLSRVTIPRPVAVDSPHLVLSPDGKTLVCRYGDGFQIDLYDTETGKPRYERSGMGSSISALAFSPDGKYVASSDRYETRLWDLATALEIATWKAIPP